MSITITGLDGLGNPYTALVALTPDEFELADGFEYGETVRIDNSLIAHQMRDDHGKPVLLTPTGPQVTMHDYDVGAVIAWLHENTRVRTADDVPPDPRIAPAPPGTEIVH